MNHLGPVIGKLNGLGKADLGKHAGIRAEARVGAEDAVNVGPDPYLIALEDRTKNRRRGIGTATAERSRLALLGSTAEAGYDREASLIEQRKDQALCLGTGGIEIGGGIAKVVVGNQNFCGINVAAGCP